MSVSDLSSRTQDYLKVIWGLQEWSDAPVTPTRIAERVGVRLSTVSEAVRKLDEQGLVQHARYGAITLTAVGRASALSMVRRHRLIEAFLASTLSYGWDEVHAEAEVLEHAVSDDLVNRIEAFLGSPTRDPHGDPIPSVDGALDMPNVITLTDALPGQQVRVERVCDTDADMLRFFETRGIVYGAKLQVLTKEPYAGSVVVQVDLDAEPATLGVAASDALRVSALD